MRIIERVLPYDHDYYLFGDDHEGSLCVYDKGRDKMIDEIEGNSLAYWTHHGDWCETTTVNHPYYDPTNLKKDPNNGDAPSIPAAQSKAQAARYRPIAHKGIAALIGNHERRVLGTVNLVSDICERIDRPDMYGGYICKIVIRDPKGKVMYKHLAFHGRRIADSRAGTEKQRQANREASLMKVLAPLAGDCVLMSCGHTHRLIVSEPLDRLYLTDNGKDIQQNYIKAVQNSPYIDPENRYFINTGSFYRSQMIGHDTYAEIAGLPPVQLGYAVVHVRDGKIQPKVECRYV